MKRKETPLMGQFQIDENILSDDPKKALMGRLLGTGIGELIIDWQRDEETRKDADLSLILLAVTRCIGVLLGQMVVKYSKKGHGADTAELVAKGIKLAILEVIAQDSDPRLNKALEQLRREFPDLDDVRRGDPDKLDKMSRRAFQLFDEAIGRERK